MAAFHNSYAFRCGSALQTPTDRQIDKYIARCMNLKIISKQKNQTTNPTPYGKPKRTPSEKNARSVALGRSLVIIYGFQLRLSTG